jgi:hypothetical protein
MIARDLCGGLVIAVVVAVSVATSGVGAAAEPCRTVRGRMELTNGTPSVRIWIVGTKRILGVHQQDEVFDQLPVNIRRAWEGTDGVVGHQLFGDFRVCPLTPSHPGWMQMVRVESGRNLRRD